MRQKIIKFLIIFTTLVMFGSVNAEQQALLAKQLINGDQGLENFNILGQAQWLVGNGAILSNSKEGEMSFLVSKEQYKDYSLIVEFWASDNANSGVFLRCQNPDEITDRNCYEVNIFDQRPEPSYATGSVVNFAVAPQPPILVGGAWNTYEIEIHGNRLKVKLNGRTTVDLEDDTFSDGYLALQWGQGEIRFRHVELTPID